MSISMMDAALAYARNGIPVFPLNGKIPLTEHGLKDATTDEKQIKTWWTQNPNANIGGVCGEISNMIVLDIDPDHGGLISLNNILSQEKGRTLDCPRVQTGRNGFHYYFSWPGCKVPPSVGFQPGLDIRGDGSYVVLPPSKTDGVYKWLADTTTLTFPQMPDWLMKLIEEKEKKAIDTTPVGEPIIEGGRNEYLTSIAGKMRNVGATENAIYTQLTEINKARCKPPLTDIELRNIAHSIARYETRDSKHEAEINDLQAEGRKIFDKLVSTITTLIHLTKPYHSRLIALYIMETYFSDLLPAVFYIGFKGTKGSGKSVTLSLISELSYKGIMTGNVSVAALARELNEKVSLCVDELDELKGDTYDLVQGALRQGYRRGSYYLRWDVKNHKQEKINIYGPKALALRTELEDALTDRAFIIGMEKKYDPEMITKVIDNFTRDTTQLRNEIYTYAKRVQSKIKVEDIILWVREEKFKKMLESVMSEHGSPRDAELASIAIIIGKILGLDEQDILDTVKNALDDKMTTTYEDDVRTISEMILMKWNGDGRPEFIEIGFIIDMINQDRKNRNMKPYDSKKVIGILRDIGLRDGVDIKSIITGNRGRPRTAIFFDKDTVKILEGKPLYTKKAIETFEEVKKNAT